MSSKVSRIPEAWASPDARCFHGSSRATSWITATQVAVARGGHF